MAKLRLPLPLRDADSRVVNAAWHEVRARREGRTRTQGTRRGLALVLAAALSVAIFALATRRPPSPAVLPSAFQVGATLDVAASTTPERRAFVDGSWVEVGRDARAVWSVTSAATVRLRVERGRVDLHVEPNGPRTWFVDAGPTTVTVVGTDLFVVREVGSTTVGVDHGGVAVRGPGVTGDRRVAAGERTTIADGAGSGNPTLGASSAAALPNALPIDALPSSRSAGSSRPSVPARDGSTAQTTWRDLASDGRPGEAFAALGEAGIASELARAPDAKVLLELADVARLAGHPSLAVEPLERLLRLHPRDPNATIAAFTLGKLELDELGHPDRAARAFAECIRLGPPRSLAQDAHARRVDALAQSGDADGARGGAREYRRLYPAGAHLPQLERWLSD